MSDLKLAFRSVLNRPGFAAVAIITLGLGLGAATAIFSVVNAVLLRPPPFPHQEQIVDLREMDERGTGMRFAEPNFNDLVARSRSFKALARYSAWPQAVAGGHEPIRTKVCAASANFFRVLGTVPFTGRFFTETKAEPVAVVSYGFWQGQLGAPANLNGIALRIGDRSFAVIGVLPPDLEFPPTTDVWYPAETLPAIESRTAHNWEVVGRLKAGVTIDRARPELDVIGRQLKREHGRDIDAQSFAALPLRERSVKNVRGMLFVFCGAVGLLLVIACSNVANLLLVRAAVRRKEIAVRAALGASTTQLARQFVTEALVLTFTGGALGVVLALWGVDLIIGLYHGNLPRVGRIGLDLNVLLFSLTLATVLGFVLGLVPALHASRTQFQADLQETGRGQSASQASRRFCNALVIAQVALSVMLLVGAGLLGRSFQRLMEVKPGFEPESAVAMTVSMPQSEDSAGMRQVAQFYQELLARLQAIPGVIAVGGTNVLPMSGGGANGAFLMIDSGVAPKSIAEFSQQMSILQGAGKTGNAQYRVVSADYLSAIRVPVRRGRLFQGSDGRDTQHVAVVSESLARRYWPNGDPIGKQIEFGNMDGDLRLLTIVGVVGDVRDTALDVEAEPTVYVDYIQRPAVTAEFSFVLRGHGDAAALIASMRREARAANPQMPIKFETLPQLVSSSLDNRRFSMVMVGVFAGAALVLAMIGLYGVMAYITAQRTNEVGIRMALGAQRADVLRLILRQSFILVSLGITAGVIGAVASTPLLRSFLYEIRPTDAVTYGVVVLMIGIAALFASYIPARRAMRVDPAIALRHE
jgi:putative ABC transport system permease protein